MCCFLVLLVPISTSAEDSSKYQGKMQWDIDRVLQGENEENRHRTESELEKTFPELFNDETYETIHSVEKENKESMTELENSLFSVDIEKDGVIDDTKEALFTSDYVAPKPSDNNDDESEKEGNWFNNMLFGGLAGLGAIVLGGMYMMVRQLSN